MKKYFLACLFFIFFSGIAFANPFTGNAPVKSAPAPASSVERVHHAEQKSASFLVVGYNKLLREVNSIQRTMRFRMSALGREMKADPSGTAFMSFLLFSFFYGVIHALGPGHGKSIVFSYFLGKKGTFWKGVLMGNVLTAVHTLSAVVLVLGTTYFLHQRGSRAMMSATQSLQQVSYLLIIALGLFIVLQTLFERFHKSSASSPSHGDASIKSVLSVSCVAGLVPCPGAALLLSFALSLGLLGTGLLGVLCFAIGMGLTTSCFGVASIHSRRVFLYVSGKNSAVLSWLHCALALLAGLGIAAMGWLLYSSL